MFYNPTVVLSAACVVGQVFCHIQGHVTEQDSLNQSVFFISEITLTWSFTLTHVSMVAWFCMLFRRNFGEIVKSVVLVTRGPAQCGGSGEDVETLT